MAVVKVRNSGVSAGVPVTKKGGPQVGGGQRGDVEGWTLGSARRNALWLQQIDHGSLVLVGAFAVTLTLRENPESAEQFAAMRSALFHRWKRLGVEAVHWCVEWTARGIVHLHCFVRTGQPDIQPHALALPWLAVCARHGLDVQIKGQSVEPVYQAYGWLRYVAKHSARGVYHYQRSGLPAGWTKTGRLWGHTGPWPVKDEISQAVGSWQFHRFRRLLRAYLIAEARQRGDWRAVARARRSLACSNRRLAKVKGVGAWIPEEVSVKLLAVSTGQVG